MTYHARVVSELTKLKVLELERTATVFETALREICRLYDQDADIFDDCDLAARMADIAAEAIANRDTLPR